MRSGDERQVSGGGEREGRTGGVCGRWSGREDRTRSERNWSGECTISHEINGESRRKDKEWGSVVTEKWAPASRAREMDHRAIRA